MSQATFFVQGCPTCGRASQVRVEYLGKPVQCRHCGGEFLASDSEMSYPEGESQVPEGKGLGDRTQKPGSKPR